MPHLLDAHHHLVSQELVLAHYPDVGTEAYSGLGWNPTLSGSLTHVALLWVQALCPGCVVVHLEAWFLEGKLWPNTCRVCLGKRVVGLTLVRMERVGFFL